MRVYEREKIKEIYCNRCGKRIEAENEVIKEGVFQVDKKWGYFSEKDGIMHSFDLCEKCYDKMIARFKYPVTVTDYSELV